MKEANMQNSIKKLVLSLDVIRLLFADQIFITSPEQNTRLSLSNTQLSFWSLKDTLKAFHDFKNKQQQCMKYCFLICKSIYIKFVQYIIHWEKTQMLKKIPSCKINVTKNALFFLSGAPTHHSFTFTFAISIRAEAHDSCC